MAIVKIKKPKERTLAEKIEIILKYYKTKESRVYQLEKLFLSLIP